MSETNYSIDLRTNNGLWARMASWFVGGRLVNPNQGSQTGPVSAHGHLGDSSITDERALQISTVWACVRLISSVTSCLPLDVFETKNDNRQKVDLNNPLARLLRQCVCAGGAQWRGRRDQPLAVKFGQHGRAAGREENCLPV